MLALIAGTVSYLHMHLLVQLHGQPGWVAALTPLSVDGMIVAASTTLLAESRSGGRGGMLPWALLAAGSVASLAANVAVAEPTATGRVIAAWPSFALIDVHERHRVLAGQQRGAAGQPGQQQPVHLPQLQHVTPGERAQERPQRGRRPDPAEQDRHRPMPQQVQVIDAVRPAGHPGDQAATFTAAFTPHRPTGRTCAPARSPRPARWARAITGTRPARDTRSGSSNVAWIFARLCNNRTCEVPSPLGIWKLQ